MNAAPVRKHHRQRALLRLIAERKLATQSDVARALRRAGFEVTQATVSRDIEELGLVKVTRDGAHVYAAPTAVASGAGTERLRRFCEDYPVDAVLAGDLIVLRSLPGSASALAAALDAAALDGIVGTIAGDDTVFAAVRDGRSRTLLARLERFGVRRRRGDG